ncbi:MAG: PEP-CTERM sorting domain-containing protein [Roseibacillus sp.]
MIYLSDGPEGFADVTGIPEPSALLLSTLGLLGLVGLRRRK